MSALLERLKFRLQLLPGTLAEAYENVPFYRRHWGGGDDWRIRSLDDLSNLPLLTRAAVEEADDFIRMDRRVASVIHSSGSTGRPFVRYRSAEELGIIWEVGTRTALVRSKWGSRPRVVYTTLSEAVHGSAVRVPTSALPISIGVTSRWLLDTAVDLIRRDPVSPGAENATKELHGRPRHLTVLADALCRHADERTRAAITSISTVGAPVHSRTRLFLEAAFPRAEIIESYSLSEIIGGAKRCERCSLYHPDAPIVAEVIDLANGRPVSDGTGMLVLTELYPFSQLQPFIRYVTGDLVRAASSGCGPGMSFEFLGRAAQTPMADLGRGQEVLLTVQGLAEVLGELPDVARAPAGGRLCPPYDVLPLGSPYAHMESRRGEAGAVQLNIAVGVTFSPRLYPDRAEAVRRQIVDGLVRSDPHFRAALQNGVSPQVELRDRDDYPEDLSLGK